MGNARKSKMKTVIFSDTHLTNMFDEKRYLYLKKIISDSDKVIINGDFWKGTVVSFNDFAESKWNLLFPLLLKKEAIYVQGNHDDLFIKKNSTIFAVECCKKYVLKTKKYEYIITHGDIYTLPRKVSIFFTFWQLSVDKILKTHKFSERIQLKKL